MGMEHMVVGEIRNNAFYFNNLDQPKISKQTKTHSKILYDCSMWFAHYLIEERNISHLINLVITQGTQKEIPYNLHSAITMFTKHRVCSKHSFLAE